MAKVEAFVWHDMQGNITAVGHLVGGPGKIVEPLVHGDRRVLKLAVDQEYLPTLHLTHTIDVARGILSPRAYRPATSD